MVVSQHFFPLLQISQKLKHISRVVKKFLSSRPIMISRRLWNSHQRHKFLRAEASRDILKFRVSEMPVPGVSRRYFPPRMPCCFVRICTRLGTIALENSQAFHDIAQFECSTDLNLFKYAFNVIQYWETDALQFYSMVLIFCQRLWQKEMKAAG